MCKFCETFEISLSDHHELIFVMKSGISKRPPLKKVFRSSKIFVTKNFNISSLENWKTLNDAI